MTREHCDRDGGPPLSGTAPTTGPTCVIAPTVGQVDERIRADDDTLNALQKLARNGTRRQ
jgi:hypothetical protein